MLLSFLVGSTMWLSGEVGNIGFIKGSVVGLPMSLMTFIAHGGGWGSMKTRSGTT
jgi:hypothetical protein